MWKWHDSVNFDHLFFSGTLSIMDRIIQKFILFFQIKKKCMYVCTLYVCLVPPRRPEDPWDWSYRCLWAIVWVLELHPVSWEVAHALMDRLSSLLFTCNFLEHLLVWHNLRDGRGRLKSLITQWAVLNTLGTFLVLFWGHHYQAEWGGTPNPSTW